MRLLTFDPGKENFAFCLFEDGVVLEHGFIETMKDLSAKGFNAERANFCAGVRDLVQRASLNPKEDRIIIERYMIRPGRGIGGNGEWINLMIGLLTGEAGRLGIAASPITAAVWKNYMKKHYSMPKKGMRELFGRPKGMTAHEADAIGIACYYYETDANTYCVNSCLQKVQEHSGMQNTKGKVK